jgi:hypothetical protein
MDTKLDIYNIPFNDYIPTINKEADILGIEMEMSLIKAKRERLEKWADIEQQHGEVTDPELYQKIQPVELDTYIQQLEELKQAWGMLWWELRNIEPATFPVQIQQTSQYKNYMNGDWTKSLNTILKKVEGQMKGDMYEKGGSVQPIYSLLLEATMFITANYK